MIRKLLILLFFVVLKSVGSTKLKNVTIEITDEGIEKWIAQTIEQGNVPKENQKRVRETAWESMQNLQKELRKPFNIPLQVPYAHKMFPNIIFFTICTKENTIEMTNYAKIYPGGKVSDMVKTTTFENNKPVLSEEIWQTAKWEGACTSEITKVQSTAENQVRNTEKEMNAEIEKDFDKVLIEAQKRSNLYKTVLTNIDRKIVEINDEYGNDKDLSNEIKNGLNKLMTTPDIPLQAPLIFSKDSREIYFFLCKDKNKIEQTVYHYIDNKVIFEKIEWKNNERREVPSTKEYEKLNFKMIVKWESACTNVVTKLEKTADNNVRNTEEDMFHEVEKDFNKVLMEAQKRFTGVYDDNETDPSNDNKDKPGLTSTHIVFFTVGPIILLTLYVVCVWYLFKKY